MVWGNMGVLYEPPNEGRAQREGVVKRAMDTMFVNQKAGFQVEQVCVFV